MLEEDAESDENTYFNANHFGESRDKQLLSAVSREHNNKHTQMIISMVQKIIKNSRDSLSRPQAAKFKPYLLRIKTIPYLPSKQRLRKSQSVKLSIHA